MSVEAAPETSASASVPEAAALVKEKFYRRAWNKVKTFIATRQPRRGFVIFVTVVWVMLMGLGAWQIIRLHAKNDWISETRAKLAEPINLQTKIWPQDNASWRELEYEPMAVRGKWIPLFRFKLMPRTYEGQTGYQLLVPLQLDDRQVILVNRGFVPDGQAILPPLEGEEVIIQGVGRTPEKNKPWQTPENIPSRNLWTWVDMPALKHEIGVDKMAPIILYEARNAESSDFPIGGQLPVVTRNNHAEYALTWYALALGLLCVALAASKARTTEQAATTGEEGSNKIEDPVAERGLYPEATD